MKERSRVSLFVIESVAKWIVQHLFCKSLQAIPLG